MFLRDEQRVLKMLYGYRVQADVRMNQPVEIMALADLIGILNGIRQLQRLVTVGQRSGVIALIFIRSGHLLGTHEDQIGILMFLRNLKRLGGDGNMLLDPLFTARQCDEGMDLNFPTTGLKGALSPGSRLGKATLQS